MKYETLGGLRGRNSVPERGTSCLREGGGAGYPLEAHPPSGTRLRTRVWGGGSHSHSHSHSRIHSQPCCKIYEKRSHARKIDVFWRRTPRFCVGAVCARLVVRDAGWEQACVRSFARVFCVSQERWVVDGADRQQVRNTLNVHDSGLQAALSFTWRCIVGNGGSSSLSEDDSTRSRTNFQQAQVSGSSGAQLANAWRKQQCFVVKKSYGRTFFCSTPYEQVGGLATCRVVQEELGMRQHTGMAQRAHAAV